MAGSGTENSNPSDSPVLQSDKADLGAFSEPGIPRADRRAAEALTGRAIGGRPVQRA
jgi:hypothetical protein